MFMGDVAMLMLVVSMVMNRDFSDVMIFYVIGCFGFCHVWIYWLYVVWLFVVDGC